MCHFLDVALLSGKIVFKRAAVVTLDLQSSSALALLFDTMDPRARLSSVVQYISVCRIADMSDQYEWELPLWNSATIRSRVYSATLHLQHRRRTGWLAATIHHCYLMLSPRPE